MKQQTTCRFASKMIQDKWTQEKVLAHMKECPVCEKIGKRIAFEIQHELGFDLKQEGKPGDAIGFINSCLTAAENEGKGISSVAVVFAAIKTAMELDLDVTGVKDGEGLKNRVRDALNAKHELKPNTKRGD